MSLATGRWTEEIATMENDGPSMTAPVLLVGRISHQYSTAKSSPPPLGMVQVVASTPAWLPVFVPHVSRIIMNHHWYIVVSTSIDYVDMYLCNEWIMMRVY